MISIVVPTLNEAKSIGILAERTAAVMGMQPYELIVVDDNSPDNTWRIAGELPTRYCVKVVRRTGQTGLSSAVVDGFAVAKGDILCVMDADLSHPPEALPTLVAALGERGADLIIASRLVAGGGTEGWPSTRKITSRIAALLARPITSVKDPLSGFFVFKRKVLDRVRLKPRGYKIGLEIIIKGNAEKIVEVPFLFKDRTAGESKLGMKQNIEYLVQLLDLYIYKITGTLWPRKSP